MGNQGLENSVTLLGYYGSDETHACSAWTSTSLEVSQNDKIFRIPQLLDFLAQNGHETPFEKSCLHFLVKTDIATHIHLLKHRIGVSINAESARYRELKTDAFYIPNDWPEEWKNKLVDFNLQANNLYHSALAELSPILGKKRAKESSRFFRTYSSQITADVMFNWRSFNHFLELRLVSDSQGEIRRLAEKMLFLVRDIDGQPFKHTIRAFGWNTHTIAPPSSSPVLSTTTIETKTS